MEGNAFRYNPKTGKVVLSSHYEDENGYTAAKIYLAQITPKGKLEVGTMERPLGHDSRDQSLLLMMIIRHIFFLPLTQTVI